MRLTRIISLPIFTPVKSAQHKTTKLFMKKPVQTLIFSICLIVPGLALAQPDTVQNPSAQHKAKAIAMRMAEDLQPTLAQTNAVEQLALERFQNLKLENPADETRFSTGEREGFAQTGHHTHQSPV